MLDWINKILVAYRFLSKKQIKINKDLDQERAAKGLGYLLEEDPNEIQKRQDKLIDRNNFYIEEDRLYEPITKKYQSRRQKDLAQIVSNLLKNTKLDPDMEQLANKYGGMKYLSWIALKNLPNIDREEKNYFELINADNAIVTKESSSKEYFTDIFESLTKIHDLNKGDEKEKGTEHKTLNYFVIDGTLDSDVEILKNPYPKKNGKRSDIGALFKLRIPPNGAIFESVLNNPQQVKNINKIKKGDKIRLKGELQFIDDPIIKKRLTQLGYNCFALGTKITEINHKKVDKDLNHKDDKKVAKLALELER